ncbi:MAG: DUF5926 family protein [Actinomycetaceae bacterium]|nr:DUF5926 family protein [Actinomycetaceae bacterium]
MSKKNRRKPSRTRAQASRANAAQAAHANTSPATAPAKPARAVIPFVERPFEGLAAEPDLVAMREILPLATLPARTKDGHDVIFATILPSMSAALRRADGTLLVAIQTVMSSGDASLDIAARITRGQDLAPGEVFQVSEQPEPGPRLADILDPDGFGELTLHEEPSFWMTDEDAAKPENQQALQDARERLVPTRAVEGVDRAFWCRMNREFVRWVRPEPRDAVLDGLARLRASGDFSFDDSRFVGAFRALGLIIPVWELQRGSEADELAGPMAEFAPRLEAAIASTEPLSPEEKRARAGIVSRQVSLR